MTNLERYNALREEWEALKARFPSSLAGWILGIGRSWKTFGWTKWKEKKVEVSRFHLENSPFDLVLNTLRHEVAHVLAGRDAGHGKEWKAAASQVGAIADRLGTWKALNSPRS